MQEEKTGFVYVWRDRKHDRYYIGSHWGTVDDGYICSSTWMRHAHRRRPDDFKRRIVKRITTNRHDLLTEEQRWINMIPEDQFSVGYFNHNKKILQNAWWADPERAKTIGERISQSHKGKIVSEETRRKISKYQKGKSPSDEVRHKIRETLRGRSRSEETRRKISEGQKGRPAWNRGKTSSEETRRKIREARSRQVISDETRRKLSDVHKGKKHSEETKLKISNSRRNEI